MKTILLVALVATVVPSLALADDVACFDFDCQTHSGEPCLFDASCSSADPFIWKIAFDWGDGTGTGLSGTFTHEHEFITTGNECFKNVTLWVYAWSGNVEQVSCEVIFRQCNFFPIGPQSGRCTSED